MSKEKPLICVDFDGVLNDYEGWRGPNYMYSPRPGAAEFLGLLQENYTVGIFSTRSSWRLSKWLDYYNMPYDKIVTGKVPAVAYIDDRALRFDGNYHKVLYELRDFKTHWEKKYHDGVTHPDFDEDDGLRFHLAYESDDGWWAVNDGGVTLWKEEVIYELNELDHENEKLRKENESLVKDFDIIAELYAKFEVTLQQAIKHERTDMGKSVLKQLADTLEVPYGEKEI